MTPHGPPPDRRALHRAADSRQLAAPAAAIPALRGALGQVGA
jgi:hypothetical protein